MGDVRGPLVRRGGGGGRGGARARRACRPWEGRAQRDLCAPRASRTGVILHRPFPGSSPPKRYARGRVLPGGCGMWEYPGCWELGMYPPMDAGGGRGREGGRRGHMVDGPDSAWRNRAPGPHRNTARQAMDGLWAEVCGQQKQSNDPGNNQHIPNTPIIGRR